MAKLNVDIVTPERRLASVHADEVVAPAAEGLYGVRPGHTADARSSPPALLATTLPSGGRLALPPQKGSELSVPVQASASSHTSWHAIPPGRSMVET